MLIREHLKADLKQAMKAREAQTVTTLRSLLAALDNAEAVELDPSFGPVVGKANEVPRKILSEAQIVDILTAEAEELRAAAAEYRDLGEPERADALRAAIAVVDRYVSTAAPRQDQR